MKVTPLDLKKAEFKRVMRGFDPGDVSEMMAAAAETLEELVRENRELKDKVNNLSDRLKSYESMEHTLNETLITAQKAGDSTRQAAERESELIVARAEVQAEKLIEEAKSELKRIRYQIEMLEHEKDAYLVKMRSLVASQWKLLQEDVGPQRHAGREQAAEQEQEQPEPVAESDEVSGEEAPGMEAEAPPVDEGEQMVEEEQEDFGNLSDKLGKILGSRDEGEEPLESLESIEESELEVAEELAVDEEMEESPAEELENLPQEPGEEGDEEKPDVFWGDDQPEEVAEEEEDK